MAIIVPRAARAVQQEAIPGARVGVNAPAGAFGSDLSEFNRVAQSIFVEEKQKADQTAFFAADLAAAKAQAALESKYKQERVGGDAVGAAPDADVEYEKVLADISSNLSADQRVMFERSASQRRAALNSSLEHHAASETAKFRLNTNEAYISEARGGAASAADFYSLDDPVGAVIADNEIATSIKRQEAAIVSLAKDNGMGELWVKVKSAEARALTHRAVIDVMLSKGNDLMAQDYFKIHEKEIVGADNIAHLNKSLREGSVRGESQRQSDAIIQQYGSWEQRNKAASAIKDPQVRAATKQLLDEEFGRETRFKNDRRNEAFLYANDAAEKAGSIRAIDPATWKELSPQERTAIETRLKHINEGTEPVNDINLWTEFQFKSAAQLAKLTAADMLRDYRPRLDNAHYERALAQVAAAQNALAKGGAFGLSAMQSDSDVVKNVFLRYTDEPSYDKLSSKQKKQFMLFSDKASVAVQDFELSKGRKATDEEKQKIVGGVLAKTVYLKEWGSDPKMPVALLPADTNPADAYVPMAEIPLADRTDLVNLARSKGTIPQNATQDEAERFLGERIERAYGMYRIGASKSSVMEVLTGGPRMLPKSNNRSAAGLIKRAE